MITSQKSCRVCDDKLVVGENWYPSSRERRDYICKSCIIDLSRRRYQENINGHADKIRQRYKENINGIADKVRRRARLRRYSQGGKPLGENPQCGAYLGIHIAERVLAKVFKDVKVMPYSHKGFDFICNRGMKIDVKSSCMDSRRGHAPRWRFQIRHNATADYFLCLAFDNRRDLNPCHAWMLPGNDFNTCYSTSIGITTIQKWDEYRIDIDQIVACCEETKTSNRTVGEHVMIKEV